MYRQGSHRNASNTQHRTAFARPDFDMDIDVNAGLCCRFCRLSGKSVAKRLWAYNSSREMAGAHLRIRAVSRRAYTLSYSPHEFPDPVFANKVWDKRSNYNCCLGAAIAAAALYWTGIIHSWWVVLLVFLVSILLVGLVQIGLVALIIFGRTAKIMFRVKLGLSPGSPWLAPFVWGYYLTPEEKRSALGKK